MIRPTVILNVFSSIDGKITTAPNHNVSEWTQYGIDGEAHDITHRLYDELDCDALVSGSETLLVYENHWVELEPQVYEPKKSKAYLEQLEEKGITYITAGSGEHIDLALALEQLYDMGFRKLGISGGGGINGAFLRNGLVDEISIVFASVVVGGRKTPSLFDCDELQSVHEITTLEPIQVKQFDAGSVWMHYKVKSNH